MASAEVTWAHSYVNFPVVMNSSESQHSQNSSLAVVKGSRALSSQAFFFAMKIKVLKFNSFATYIPSKLSWSLRNFHQRHGWYAKLKKVRRLSEGKEPICLQCKHLWRLQGAFRRILIGLRQEFIRKQEMKGKIVAEILLCHQQSRTHKSALMRIRLLNSNECACVPLKLIQFRSI